MTLFRSKYLYIDWGSYSFTTRKGISRQRKWRHRHNRRVYNHYVQVGPLEVTLWYR